MAPAIVILLLSRLEQRERTAAQTDATRGDSRGLEASAFRPAHASRTTHTRFRSHPAAHSSAIAAAKVSTSASVVSKLVIQRTSPLRGSQV